MKWVNVNDALPSAGKRCIVCDREGNVFSANYDNGVFMAGSAGGWYKVVVQHWMYYPDSPKIKQENENV